MQSNKVLSKTVALFVLSSAFTGLNVLPVYAAPDTGDNSITVFKRSVDAGNTVYHGTGLEDTNAPGVPIQGVSFKSCKVTKIGDDTVTARFVKDLVKNGKPVNVETVDEDSCVEKTTDDQGSVKFDSLPNGLYRIVETVTPDGVAPAEPLFIFAPYSDGTQISKDVTVYPKGYHHRSQLSVNDKFFTGGAGSIVYTGYSDVYSGVPNKPVDSYSVTANLDPRLKVNEIKIMLGSNNGASGKPNYINRFKANEHYRVTREGGSKVTVNFTPEGLALINAASGASLGVFTVFSAVPTDGNVSANVLSNGAYNGSLTVKPSGDAKWGTEPVVSNTATTNVGRLTINRTNETVPLAGLMYAVFNSTENAQAATRESVLSGKAEGLVGFRDRDGKLVLHTSTDDKGSVVFNNLRYSNFFNGVDNPDANGQKYYVAEIPLKGTPSGATIIVIDSEAKTLNINGAPDKGIGGELDPLPKGTIPNVPAGEDNNKGVIDLGGKEYDKGNKPGDTNKTPDGANGVNGKDGKDCPECKPGANNGTPGDGSDKPGEGTQADESKVNPDGDAKANRAPGKDNIDRNDKDGLGRGLSQADDPSRVSSQSKAPNLAKTGADIAPYVAGGIGATILGFLLVLLTRRKEKLDDSMNALKDNAAGE